MPSVEFEVWCSCGNGLCNQTSTVGGGIEVAPCEKCLQGKYDEGHGEGYEEGYLAGREDCPEIE